jgi:CrcB protein
VIPESPALLVGLGGALGATLRYAVGEALADRDTPFPVPTLAVNTLGTFTLGVLTFAGAGEDALLLFGTGLCGAFTTFSSFSVETVRLWDAGTRGLALAYALGTLALAGVALAAAWSLAGVV